MEEAPFEACKSGDLPQVQYLVEEGANIHAKDDYALLLSAKNGHLSVVEYLVVKGANIHARNSGALRCAVQYGHLDVVQYLIEKGANIHTLDDFALCWAAQCGHFSIVMFLSKFYGDISQLGTLNHDHFVIARDTLCFFYYDEEIREAYSLFDGNVGLIVISYCF